MNKALYYPYINIPKDSWLTQSLLYWDELSCIAPTIYFENPNLYDTHMQEYIKENLVIPLSPMYFISDIQDFDENFLNFIDSDIETKKIKKQIFQGYSKQYVNVHFEKLGHLCYELIDRNLAFKGKEGWLLVESNVAFKFMTYLSMLIGSISDLDPITREDISFFSSIKIPKKFRYNYENNGDVQLKEYNTRVDELRIKNSIMNTRDKILTNLLPSPKGEISAFEILKFKEKNNDSLSAFRSYIEGFIIQYESTCNELKEKRMEDFLYCSRQMKAEIEEDMYGFGWKHLDIFDFGFYGLNILNIFSSYIQDSNSVNASLGLSSLGFAIFKSIRGNHNRVRDLTRKPMAYIVNASKKIT